MTYKGTIDPNVVHYTKKRYDNTALLSELANNQLAAIKRESWLIESFNKRLKEHLAHLADILEAQKNYGDVEVKYDYLNGVYSVKIGDELIIERSL